MVANQSHYIEQEKAEDN